MRTIRVEHERDHNSGNAVWWWAWLIPLILVGILVAIAVPIALAHNRAQAPVVAAQPAAQPAQHPMDLNSVLQANNLPREFAYGGMTWRAVDVMQTQVGTGPEMITIGPLIQGHKLYYEKGTSTKPYQTLYLRGNTQGYMGTYVRYKPTSQSGSSQSQSQ